MDNEKKVVEVNEKEPKEQMTAYYYQLQAEFYRRREIKILEKMQNGLAYAYFYLKLCVESLATNGYLRMNNLPLSVDDLAAITDIHVDTVRSAVAVLLKMGMIQQVEDGAYYLEEVTKFLKRISMTPEAIRKRRQRQKEAEEAMRLKLAEEEALRLLEGKNVTKCHADVTEASQEGVTLSHKTVTKCHESIENIDYSSENRTNSLDSLEEEEPSECNCLLTRASAPTREEVTRYCQEHCEYTDPDLFFNYYDKREWTIKGEPIVDWRSLILKWDHEFKLDRETSGYTTEELVKLHNKYKSKFGRAVPIPYLGRPLMIRTAIASETPLKGE